jgi:hypothetical protein
MRPWIAFALALLAPLAGCHLIFPYGVAGVDAGATDAGATDATNGPDGLESPAIVIKAGAKVESFDLALDGQRRAHLVYLLQGELRHATVEAGKVSSDVKLALSVDAAGTAINSDDVMLVVYGGNKTNLWRTSRDLAKPGSPWSSPALNYGSSGTFDAIELAAAGSSFYGAIHALDIQGGHSVILTHLGTQVVGCNLKSASSPLPLRVAAGAGFGATSIREGSQQRLIISKLVNDKTFCSPSFATQPAAGADPLPLAIDGKGTVHAVAVAGGKLQDTTRDSVGKTLATETGFALPGNAVSSIDLVVDGKDRIHVLYLDGTRLLWRHGTDAGGWTESTPLATGAGATPRPRVRTRSGQLGFAYAAAGGGVGYVQLQLPD